MRLNDKETINSFKTTAKTHATMDENQHLHFLLTRCGWKVTRIGGHCTFQQKKLKKDFVIMNPVLRQNVKTNIEKDFFKLMKNANFVYDCCNNADNCYFSPIYDELEELMYAKRYQTFLIKA